MSSGDLPVGLGGTPQDSGALFGSYAAWRVMTHVRVQFSREQGQEPIAGRASMVSITQMRSSSGRDRQSQTYRAAGYSRSRQQRNVLDNAFPFIYRTASSSFLANTQQRCQACQMSASPDTTSLPVGNASFDRPGANPVDGKSEPALLKVCARSKAAAHEAETSIEFPHWTLLFLQPCFPALSRTKRCPDRLANDCMGSSGARQALFRPCCRKRPVCSKSVR